MRHVQILQSLLQNTGAAQRLPANWSSDGDSQERSRVFQLQALLAALQVDSVVQSQEGCIPTQAVATPYVIFLLRRVVI